MRKMSVEISNVPFEGIRNSTQPKKRVKFVL